MNKKGLMGTIKISAIIFTLIILGFFVVNYVLPASADGEAWIWTTDSLGNVKTDFEPGDIVYIHGTGFNPPQVNITITRPDQNQTTDSETTNAEGDFVYVYDLDGITGEYNVYAFDGTNSAQTTFTDSRTIDWATVDGGSSTTVSPGATITVELQVTLTGSGSGNDWESTRYLIEGGSWQCEDTPDHTWGGGTHTESFTITAPMTPGVYDFSVRAYDGDTCSASNPSSIYFMNNAITVSSVPVCGNGIIDGSDKCDDGNTDNGDGCSSTCTVESGWSCTGQPSVCTVDNPTLPSSCGIDIALIIDNSGSISSSELTTMKNAFKDFVDAFLPYTPTQMALIKFNTNGDLVLDYNGDATTIKDAINSVGTSSGYTNWDDGLKEAYDEFDNSPKPDLYIFASDGQPNRWGDPAQGSGSGVDPDALNAAIARANTIKLSGVRIITLGIGTGGDPSFINNLKAISSDDAYYDTNFETLAQTLADLADDLCGGTVTVKKLVDGQPESGWVFSTSVTGGSSTPPSSTTDGTGFINPVFDIDIPGTSATVTVTETSQGGYDFVSAFCIYQNQSSAGTPGQGTVTGIVVGKLDAVYCEFENTAYECETNDDCNDDLYCNGEETCISGNCVNGTPVDCSMHNILGISTCYYDPDLLDETFDWRDPFTSVCVEDGCNTGHCTTGDETINHACADGDNTDGVVNYNGIQTCSAECDGAGTECQNKCVGPVLYTSGICDTGDCYCDYDTYDCSQDDGWYNETETRWVDHPTDPCKEIEQINQTYRAYTCFENAEVYCGYYVNDMRWLDTGEERAKVDVTGPTVYNLSIKMECNKINITAVVEDLCSNINQVIYDFDQCPTGNPIIIAGGSLIPVDGTFDEKREEVYLNNVNVKFLGDGRHTLYVRGEDEPQSPGNWGPCASVGFDVDALPPNTEQQSVTPNMTCGNDPTVTGLICDAFNESGICYAEYFIDDFTKGNGEGFPMNPMDGDWEDYCEWVNETIDITPLNEGTHYVQVGGADCACNWVKFDLEPAWFIKDTTAPKTTKSIGDPKVACEDDCDWYITQDTEITLTCYDFNPDNNTNDGYNDLPGEYSDDVTIYWKYRVDGGSWQEFNHSGNQVMLKFPEDTTHELEYWCEDWCGNEELPHHVEIDIVDTQEPVIEKTVGEPKVECEDDCDWYINQSTVITLNCTDQDPHPVNDVTLYWRDYLRGEEPPAYTPDYDGYVEIQKQEDCEHVLEYYCNDSLGNMAGPYMEIDIVDTQPPVTTKEIIGPEYWDVEDHYIDGVTLINLTCVDPDPHPVGVDNIQYRYYWNGEWTNWFVYAGPFNFPEESYHELEYYCNDTLGNEEQHHFQDYYVDKTPPNTTKTYGQPFYTDGVSEWITTSTLITLRALDPEPHPSGVNKTYWRNTLVDERYCSGEWDCNSAQGSGLWNEYVEPFTKSQESCHLIEFYSVDNVNKTETVKKQCVYVEDTPPVIEKTVGDPKHACEGMEECDWYINQSTVITLNCTDLGPHPVNNVTLYYRDYLMERQIPEFTMVPGGYVQFNKSEDSIHFLEYYCEDALGNSNGTSGEPIVEIDIVDSEPPEITKTIIGPYYGECPPDTKGECYIDGVTKIQVDVVDPDPHPVDHVYCEWSYYWNDSYHYGGSFSDQVNITFAEDCTHELHIECWDALGNYIEDVETFFVDKTPPNTTKTYGQPFYTDGVSEWITTSTLVNLSAQDEKSGVRDTFYKDVYLEDPEDWHYCYSDCETFDVDSIAPSDPYQPEGWELYEGPFYKEPESCHIIAYYSVDNVDKVEDIKWQCVFVDNTPPVIDKTVGDPKVACEDDCDWYINQSTVITLNCTDLYPHPVNNITLYWRDYLMGEEPPAYTPDYDGYVEIQKQEDCEHVLEYYCVDALGNSNGTEEKPIVEIDIVDSEPPIVEKIVGEPKIACDDYEIPDEVEGCDYYITQNTPITFRCYDPEPHPVNDVEIWFRYRYKNYTEDPWSAWVGPIQYTEGPFNFPEDSIHELEYWCIDALGNKNQSVQLDVVDTEPPETNKTISDPKYWDESNGWWAITTESEFTLEGIDPEPHPVDMETTKYRVWFKCHDDEEWQLIQDWTVYTVPFSYSVEGMYKLEYYSWDALGNTEEIKIQIDIVDETPPEVIILKPVDDWYAEGDPIPIDIFAEDFDNCAPAVGIADGTQCNVYLVGIIPFQIIPLDSTYLKYNESLKQCVGWAILNTTAIPEGSVGFLVVTVSDRSGNTNTDIQDITDAYGSMTLFEFVEYLKNNYPPIGIEGPFVTSYDFARWLYPTWDYFFLADLVLDDIYGDVPHYPETILASMNKTGTPSYEIVWYFNETQWLSYAPAMPPILNTLTEFNDQISNPYWIKMLKKDLLAIPFP